MPALDGSVLKCCNQTNGSFELAPADPDTGTHLTHF